MEIRKNWGGAGWHFNGIIQGYLNLVLAEPQSCSLVFLDGGKQGIMENGIKGALLLLG